ncbi:MAG: polymer-forming cytoskeletal protein [Pseudomonadota bacterium]
MSTSNGSFADTLAQARDRVSTSVSALRAPQTRPAEPVALHQPEARQLEPATPQITPSSVSVNTKLVGSITTTDEVRVFGTIEGDIRAAALVVCAGGVFKGDIHAEAVTVHGKVEGRITARDVRLCAGANVKGEISHQTLGIDPAAIFEGSVARVVAEPAAVAAEPAAVAAE